MSHDQTDREIAFNQLQQAHHALSVLPTSLLLLFFDCDAEEVARLLKAYPGDGGLYTPPSEMLALLDCSDSYAKVHRHSDDAATNIARVRKMVIDAEPFYKKMGGRG